MSEPLLYSAEGAFTISTTWTSTAPFKEQTAAFISAAVMALNAVTRSVYSGGGGTLAMIMRDGSTMSLPTFPAGGTIDIRAIALSSSNTATGLVGFY